MEFDESIIEGAVKIANARINKRFPLIREPLKVWMAEELFSAAKELLDRLQEEKDG